MKEFVKVTSVLNEYAPASIFMLEDGIVSISALAENQDFFQNWKSYFQEGIDWPEHAKQESPLSSVFRSSYLNVEHSPLTEETLTDYQATLSELKQKGKVRTLVLKLS